MTGHTAETHKTIRKNQALNLDAYHHPTEKIEQLKKFNFNNFKILEVFAGKGNLTKYYRSISSKVVSMNKETTGDSFEYIYKVRYSKDKFDLIDIDSYGYPDKFFPVIFECLKDKSYLIFTFPVNHLSILITSLNSQSKPLTPAPVPLATHSLSSTFTQVLFTFSIFTLST